MIRNLIFLTILDVVSLVGEVLLWVVVLGFVFAIAAAGLWPVAVVVIIVALLLRGRR